MQLSALTLALGRFVSELQRRKVIRVAAGYAVVGWIVLQVALALHTAMKLPEAFSTVIVSLLIVGFPVALIAAWFFDFTSEGIKRTVSSGDGALLKPQTTDWILIGMLVLVAGTALFQSVTPRNSEAPAIAASDAAKPSAKIEPPALGDKSIAVLPFANLSPDKENEYFADGLTEELLNLLAKIGDLKVISRTSSFSFKGKDTPLPEIAKQLGVRHIVEGSVRTDGDDLRITAQLIDVSTDTHLWSETYERKVENVFLLQDEIARDIAGALKVEVTLASTGVSTPTRNLRAYRLYLEGLQYFRERDASLLKAIRLFKDALALDPNFAEAHAALAASYWTSSAVQRNKADELVILARASARSAIKLKPSLGLPYGVLGLLDRYDLKWESALANTRKAVALDPSDSNARQWLGSVYSILGRLDDGAAAIEEGVRLDPLADTPVLWLMMNRFAAGRDADAQRLAERLAPSQYGLSYVAYAVLCMLAYDRGDAERTEADCKRAVRPGDEARPLITKVAKALQSEQARQAAIQAAEAEAAADPHFNPAGIYGLLLANDALIERLERYGWKLSTRPEAGMYVTFWAPRFKSLRSDPRFKTLMRKMGYVDFWKKHGWPDQCRAKGEGDFECS